MLIWNREVITMDNLQAHAQLLHKLLSCKDLQDILDAGRQVYPHPLILCDLTHRVLAITEEPDIDHAPWKEIRSSGGIPLDKVGEPATMECYRRSMELGCGQVQPSKYGEPPMLRRALGSDKQIIGYLDSPRYSGEQFTEYDHSLFNVIADLCHLRMQKEGSYHQAPENVMEFFLADLMAGRITNEHLIAERFRHFQWNLRTPLYIITARYIHPDAQRPPISVLQGIRERIATEFPLFTTFLYGDQIKCIVPDSPSGTFDRTKIKKLEALLTKENLVAGISRPLQNLKEFSLFNRQSEKALELGLLLRPRTTLYFYDNMAVFHALEYCSSQIDTIALVHSATYTLAEYDREHQTNLLESLEAYLCCNMSTPDAANLLSIHRNTMNYRLNKIQELVDLDFDNSETVFHLLFSYHVLEYYSATVERDIREQHLRKPAIH